MGATWQPHPYGITVHVQTRFGFTAAAGSTDDPRMRIITQHIPGDDAARLLHAHAAGAADRALEQHLDDLQWADFGL